MIEFHDVGVCYRPGQSHEVNALEGVSFSIPDGGWAFLVGPSGAGKSTLLKLVYGGACASKGRIVVDGQDVTHLGARDIPALRRKIGVIFQDFQLLAQKTVWENVAFALQVIGAPQKRLVRDVPRALDIVGLVHKQTARPHELSGGEAQRVAIARAIVNNPSILLADEPTGNLDPQTAFDIAQVLRRVNESGTTILMATHDRALVDGMKCRVVRLAHGRVTSDEARGVYHPEDGDFRALAVPSPLFFGAASPQNQASPTIFGSSGSEISSPGSEINSSGNKNNSPGNEIGSPGPEDNSLGNKNGSSGSESGHAPPEVAAPVRDEAPRSRRAVASMSNPAPLGSPDNPIPQFAPDVESNR